MDEKVLLERTDHTLLKQQSTWSQIKELCDDAIGYRTASVCIPPSFVRDAKEYVGNRMKICTVIGFPNGYNTTAVKVAETIDAVNNGADEIDMVINIGWAKEKKWDALLEEMRAVRKACPNQILKVIIETCLLNEEEKCMLCELVTDAEADYIKTSTGFSEAGATFADVELMKSHVGKNVKVKAAGGISSLDDARRFVELGADRLGTSKVVGLIKNR